MSDLEIPAEIRGVLLPLQQGQLLLPNAAVCEVVGYREPDSQIEGAPGWLLGQFIWRDHSVPMVSFEQLMGQEMTGSGHRARVAICNTLNGNDLIPYIGIVLDSAPRLVRVVEDIVRQIEVPEDLGECVLNQIMVDDQLSLIPNLDAIEHLVAELP